MMLTKLLLFISIQLQGFKIVDDNCSTGYECPNYESILSEEFGPRMNTILLKENASESVSIVKNRPQCVHAMGGVPKSNGAEASTIQFTDITIHTNNNSISGYAGVNISGTFGYICDTASTPGDVVPELNVLVICHQYGYAYGSGYRTTFPQAGTVRLQNAKCTSTELDIVNCQGTVGTFSTTSCSNGAYYINCYFPYYDMYTNMRLVGGDDKSGFVEIRPEPSGTWNRLCVDDHWDENAKKVACCQLGFKSSKDFLYQTGSGSNFVRSPECEGTENNLTQCKDPEKLSNAFFSSTCQSAGVTCSDRMPEYSFNYYRQEIYVNNYWEPLCGASLLTDEEQKGLGLAVCKTLGREYISHSKDFTLFDPTTTQLRYIGCHWEVNNLTDCFKLKAPEGKGFPCYERMKVECKDVDKDNSIWGKVIGGFFIPIMICIGGLTAVVQYNKREKKRAQAAAQGGQMAGVSTVSGEAAQGGYSSGYPLQPQGNPGYPTQPQPVPLAPPPSYGQTQYTDWAKSPAAATR